MTTITKTKLSILAAAVVYAATFGQAAFADSIYTFDNLTAGTLSGQDNWKSNGGTVDVASSNLGGLCIVGAGTGTNIVNRVNDSNWSFVNTASTGIVTLLVDSKVSPGGDVLFGLGYDSNGDGIVNSNGPLFGTLNGDFFVRKGSDAGGAITGSVPFSALSGYASGDWLQEKLVMSITSAGAITGTLYARDLTQNQTDWTTIYTNVDLGTDVNATKWNGLYLRIDGVSAYSADNLTVAAVPEPSAAALAGMAFFSVMVCAWLKQRKQ